jgi:hypothetical protein
MSNVKDIIETLSKLSEEHTEMKTIIMSIFFECSNGYGIHVNDRACREAIEKQYEQMKRLVMPDFDDAE